MKLHVHLSNVVILRFHEAKKLGFEGEHLVVTMEHSEVVINKLHWVTYEQFAEETKTND